MTCRLFQSPLEEPACLEKLARDQWQLWRSQLDVSEAMAHAFWETLSSQERSRSQAFRFPLLQSRYIVARGMLRRILGQYLQQPPGQVAISAQGPGGKPQLDGSSHHDLLFNISHSGPVWVCAVTLGRDVGIDVEEVRADFDWPTIASRYFTPDEQSALASGVAAERHRLFFQYWTRKEALAKATGEGLAKLNDLRSGHSQTGWRQYDLTDQFTGWGDYAASLAICEPT